MNAMIRALKGILAVLALVGVGLLLRWVTAGSISGARTYDLDSLTVLAVGTVAWIAYVWLVLAVVTTVLEQIPGVVGALAGAVAGRITTKTARALLRSGLGVAAVTPLTVGAAQATPGPSSHVLQWNQTEPPSTIHLTDSNWRPTNPRPTLHLGGAEAHRTAATQQDSTDSWRSREPVSNLQIGGADTNGPATAEQATRSQQSSAKSEQESVSTWRSTEPASELQIGRADVPKTTATEAGSAQSRQDLTSASRATEPTSDLQVGGADANRTTAAQQPFAQSQQDSTSTWGSTEAASNLQIGGADAPRTAAAQPGSAQSHQESAKPLRESAKSQRDSTSTWASTEPASGLQIGGADTARTAAAQPGSTKAQHGSGQSGQDSTDTWRATEPASELRIGGGDAARTAAAQPGSAQAQQESAKGQQGSSQSDRDSTDTWRATEPASELRIGGGDAARTAAAHPGSAQAQQESAKGQQGSSQSDQDSTDSWRVTEPASGLHVGVEPGSKGSGRAAVSGRMRVGVPDRPTDGAPTRYTAVRAGGAVRVVVREGDSLWGLAARELGPGATDEAIAARWPDWYAVNRQVIGEDPDLILPGQVLRVPPASTGHLPPTHQEP
ncbi:hypothetical protein [Kribbella pratensis]|uniref:LysM domain-containing protein n=1 Tax=Kribbella pratensis TaxID=2512112 RepID=A0A4V3GFW6_9ACTN|nr:hypothetical protein [Kribbella pratensis]TDW69867.1 hypothetical protein EV653_3897 [Kribbella pratensis]